MPITICILLPISAKFSSEVPVIFSVAQLSADQLQVLQDLEKQTGRCIVALAGLPGEPASLSDDELARLQEAEKSLGLTLVALDS